MKLLRSISALLNDPPPVYAFEVSEAGIAAAYIPSLPAIDFQPLPPETISVSPLHDNVLLPDAFASAVAAAVKPNGKRRDAAVILPDNCARISVLDFDGFPADTKDQLPLVKFRLRKSVPFDVESAAVSYWPQHGEGKRVDVIAAVAPLEIVARYEAPFRAAGLVPGYVTTSSLAVLRLVDDKQLTVIAKLSKNVMAILVVENGALKLIRTLERGEHASLEDLSADLFPTFVYVEDQMSKKAERLLLCGFGTHTAEAQAHFERELEIAVEPLQSHFGTPGESNAGLLGYLQGVVEPV
jgi:type IV pilus assembly protein PilM